MKILAIDDNRDNLTTLKAILHDAYPEAGVLTALDGPKGIELALAEDPDVILLDIVMPGMDGFEACRRLKQHDAVKHIPVVFLTALKSDRKSRIQALEAGAEAFLSKPIDDVELIAQIRAMTRIKAAHMREQSEKDRLANLVTARTQQLVKELKERMEAEKALRESEEVMRLTLRATTDGIWKWHFLTDELTFSERYYTMLGYDPNEFPPGFESWKSLVHPDDLPSALRVAEEYLKTKPDQYENAFRLRTKGGSYRWIRAKARVVERNEAGDAVLMIGNHEDITERKLAENELIIKEKSIESSHSAIALSGLDGNVTYVNPAFLQMWGYGSKDEVLGKPSISFWMSQEKAKDVVDSSLKTGRWEGELLAKRKDGSTFTALVSANLVFDEQGKPMHKMASFIDITERKKAEEALRESEEAICALMNATTDAAFMVDLTGNILTANREMACRLGFSIDEMIGASIWDILPGEVIDERKAAMETVVRTGKMVRFEDERNGRIIHNSLHPVIDADGKVVKVAVFARDTTEQRKVEAALRERESWLRAASESSLDSFFIFRAERDDAGEIIDFVFVYVNRTAEEMLKMSRESLLENGCARSCPSTGKPGFSRNTGVSWKAEFL